MTKQYEINTNLFYAVMMAAALSGCATPIKPVAFESQGVSHKYEKNYTLNEKQRVNVGEPVIRIKDFYVERINIPMMEPTENFTVDAGMLRLDYAKGKKYNILGTYINGDDSYFIVPSDRHTLEWSNPAVLVDKNGVIHHIAQTGKAGAVVQPTSFKIVPDTARLAQLFEEKVSVTKGHENFELLFNGLDKNTMTFTYREFSPEGMARVAFYQTLTYDAKATTVRFKSFKINVFDANSEGITYAVVEDTK